MYYQLKTRSVDSAWSLDTAIRTVEWTRYPVGNGVLRDEVMGALKGRWPAGPHHVELREDDGWITKTPALIRVVFGNGSSQCYANNCEAYVMNPSGDTVEVILGGKR